MKKLLFLSFIALGALVGCKKGASPTNGNAGAVTSFRASFEQPVPGDEKSKTILGSQSGSSISVNWEEKDAVAVIYQEGSNVLHKVKFVATPDATDKTKATLTAVEDVDPNWTFQYAFYPYCQVDDAAADNVTFTLPSTQTYREGSFAQNTNPAIGKMVGDMIYFQNLCAIIEIPYFDGKGTTPPQYYYLNTEQNGNFLTGQAECTVSNLSITSTALVKNYVNVYCEIILKGDQTRTNHYCIFPFVIEEPIVASSGASDKLSIYNYTIGTASSAKYERNNIYVFPDLNVNP